MKVTTAGFGVAAAAAIGLALFVAAPAQAYPAPCGGSTDPIVIRQCVMGPNAPTTLAQTPWADCNQLQLPSDRSVCVDQHIRGQR
jgi:hypothetical protein